MKHHHTRIQFIQGRMGGPARIGRVEFSPTGKTAYYAGRTLNAIRGYKANHRDAETGEEFWLSGCKRRGGDTLYGGLVEIDDDVRVAYWTSVRREPQRVHECAFKDGGKDRR